MDINAVLTKYNLISSIKKIECNLKWKFKQTQYCSTQRGGERRVICNYQTTIASPAVSKPLVAESSHPPPFVVKSKAPNETCFDFEANNFTVPSEALSFLLPQSVTSSSNFETVTVLISPDTTRLYSVLGFDKKTRESIIENLEVQITLKENASNAQQKIWDLMQTKKLEGKQVFANQASLKCVFINTTTEMLSDYGCQSNSSQSLSQINCICNHTTVFTIVLSVSLKTVPYGVKVSKITHCLLNFTATSMVIAILFYVYFKSFKNKDQMFVCDVRDPLIDP